MSYPSPPVDLFLYGGRVLTLDPARPLAEAVAVSAGKILAVGGDNELRPLLSSRTLALSCSGQTVLPGFIDPHLHLFAWASRFCGADLSAARSIPEIQEQLSNEQLRNQGSRVQTGEWIRGYGYDEFFLKEKRHPTHQDLDIISQDRPILLRHRTGHAAVLNSPAMRRAGIDRHFSPPSGGSVERDPETGEPTGVVYESEQFLRTILPPLPWHEFIAGLKQANTELLRQGVTSFHDASAGNTLEDYALFRRFRANGMLTPRVTVMIGIDALPQLVASRLVSFSGDDHVRLGSVKIMVHESRGGLYPEPEALAEMIWQAHRNGFQVALHAVEEGALCVSLNAIEKAQQRLPRADHRHRIEHCALCPPPCIDQFVATGSGVVTQPGFLYFYGEKYTAEVDPDQHDWLYRTKSFSERGVPVVGSSDCPIAPLSPLTGIQAAMTRRSQTGIPLNIQERLRLPEALGLFTTAGAWVGFEEDRKGKIAPGLLADLIVLDRDVTMVPIEAISSLKVVTTILEGQIVWSVEPLPP